jgi:hypothetical protein
MQVLQLGCKACGFLLVVSVLRTSGAFTTLVFSATICMLAIGASEDLVENFLPHFGYRVKAPHAKREYEGNSCDGGVLAHRVKDKLEPSVSSKLSDAELDCIPRFLNKEFELKFFTERPGHR